MEGLMNAYLQKFNICEVKTKDDKCDIEIRRRIVIAKDAFENLSRVLSNRKTPLKTKIAKQLLNCYVIPVILYD